MKAPGYWKSHYVTSTDPAEIELALKQALLDIGGEGLEVIYFLHATHAPNVLSSQGSGGHGYVLYGWLLAGHQDPASQNSPPGTAAAFRAERCSGLLARSVRGAAGQDLQQTQVLVLVDLAAGEPLCCYLFGETSAGELIRPSRMYRANRTATVINKPQKIRFPMIIKAIPQPPCQARGIGAASRSR